MRRRLWISLVGIVVVVVGALVGNLVTDNQPILGLDLQGGLSVILAPDDGATGDDLIVVRDLVRSSLERSGIAEPDVRVQGSNIVVDLPGVRDKDEALRSVSVSGIVELRPVVNFADCSTSVTDPVLTEDGRVLNDDGTITIGDGGTVTDGTVTDVPTSDVPTSDVPEIDVPASDVPTTGPAVVEESLGAT